MKIKKVIARGKATTKGDGCWSIAQRTVNCKLVVDNIYESPNESKYCKYYGQINIYFPKKDWDIEKHGLIYTDSAFLKDARDILKNAGFTHYRDFEYSEQGMQGDNYVNCDLGQKLALELIDKGYAKAIEW